MRRAQGLPVAAYLAALMALALLAAFAAALAVVIWLPPKPPDVMRADEVAEHFQGGYDYMLGEGRPISGDAMVWRVEREPPEIERAPQMRLAELRLARALELDADEVLFAAEHIRERSSAVVFAVRDVDELKQELDQALGEIETALGEAEWSTREAEQNLREARAHARAEEAAAAQTVQAARGDARAVEEARDVINEAREREADAREAAHEARAAERLLRAERVRIRAGHAAAHARVDIEVSERGHVSVHRVELPAAPAPPAPPAAPASAVAPAAAAPAAALPPMFAPAPRGVALISGFEIGAQLPDGRWLIMRQGRNWEEMGWIARAALVIAGALAALFLLALLFARRLTRPIRSFAEAVQAVGIDPQSAPVSERGPRELRSAARAVNAMQGRLRALIADRTKTLAAVAHDMRTPLMRLRLAAENVSPEQRDRMAKEIGEVEALVASFIAFARDDPAEEARVSLDLAALLQSIADDRAEAGDAVSYAGPERLIVTAQSLGLKRLFSNLVENALKYGGCARMALRQEEGAAIVEVEDDGPGVPAEQREAVFAPFVRLREGAGGAGLGLPAARSIARAHGGDIVILDAPKGALVRVTLPG